MVTERIADILIQYGMGAGTAESVSAIILFSSVLVVGFLIRLILSRLVNGTLRAYATRTQNTWDDALVDKRVFDRIANFVPAMLFVATAGEYGAAAASVERLASTAIILNFIYVIGAVFDAGECIYRTYPVSRQRPIKGYLQVIKIVLWIMAAVVAVGTLLDRSPWLLVSGIGAMSAVLMLIFKDSLLGLVAGVQLTTNNMVRIGDWIDMPKYNADGDVIEITLTTVKVQNWDRTISMIPAYALISDSFRNWRGMQEAGGRRIKRAVHIDVTSIRFCTEEMLDAYERIELVQDYVRSLRAEIADYNAKLSIDTSLPVNGRRMTNVGTFRAYLNAYLSAHPHIHHCMTTMVRQLEPGKTGLPLEIYAFTNDTAWVAYEGIQSDIFDHVLAAASLFGLRIHQEPSSHDLREALSGVQYGAGGEE